VSSAGGGRQNSAAFDCGKGAKQTLLDTLPNLDDHRFEDGCRTMDVGSWLRSLGLGQYEAAFRDSAVDADVLCELSDSDLVQLGVLLGHRKRLLKAIAELPSADRIAPPTWLAPSTAAERRHLTVMFCDLVGSTALSTRLDPEDMREIIGAYHRCCANLVARNGGFVAKYMGDGVLAYFGYPRAHEHDAERAARAGLALVEALPKLTTAVGVSLQLRVGIATGLVVVGDLIGSGEAQERGVVGETPNLAARLQGIAEPNTVVIAESTRKLLGDLFELEDVGAKDLKGIAGPVRAWVVLRASSAEGRFEALHTTGLTPLVGREEELELLLLRWSRARSGEGQVVLVSGEAGIGKSRLTAALFASLAAEPHTRLRYFCSPQHTDSALHPVISQMERATGLAQDAIPRAKLDKLDAVLAPTSTSIEDAALFAEMLSLPNDGRYPVLELTPEQLRRRTLEALTSQLAALARREPILMILEDAHWIDPTSLELFGRTMDQIRTLRILLIVTFRPEFNAPWLGESYITCMALNRLGERETKAIIGRLVGDRELPSDVMAEIIERTDGIPLFVEEMTKAVLEAEREGAARRTIAAVPPTALAVPASLHASLMARLDRLGAAKEVAQIGASIGREFSHVLLAALVNKPEAVLGSILDRLIAAGLLFRQGAPPQATYLFNHALVQDIAYGTLLREPRRALHARIAQTLESEFEEIAENQPELLARHCTEAGQMEKAAGLWGKAGHRSLNRSALVEAVAQLTRALTQIAALPSTPALRREQIKLQVALAATLFHVKGYTSPETIMAFERANAMIEQAEALGERPQGEDALLRFSVMYGQWTGNYSAGNHERGTEQARQFLAAAETQALSAPLLVAHRVMGATLANSGKLDDARSHLDRAVALYIPDEHRSLATRFGQDLGVAALTYRSLVLYRLGYPESALRDAEDALNSAQNLGQAGSLGYAIGMGAILEVLCGRFAPAEARIEELSALSERLGLPFFRSLSTLLRGCIFTATDRADQATQLIVSGLSALASTRVTFLAPFGRTWLARAHAACGRSAEAQDTLSEALDAVSKTNERWDEAEIHRVAGELAVSLLHVDPKVAESHFRRSLAIAGRQRARSFELRAATSLGRLWHNEGRRAEARDLLAPIVGWFTEGFGMSDLVEAKALLEELQ
jgi:class 3 adenylate cyclase/predicted ATPase